MTTSSYISSTTMLTTLASMYSTTAQLTTPLIVDQVNGQIDKQLKQKIAALPDTGDTVMLQVTQDHINQLKKTLSTVTTVGNDSSTNAGVLSQMQNQLATLQTAAANGDSTSFDNSLSLLNTELGNLLVVPPTAPFQPDQISGLKGSGLGIQNSAYYDLSTASGQAAAAADISNAQNRIGQIFSIVTSNQLEATSLTSSLSTQIDSLNNTLQQTQTTDQLNTAAASAKLTQQAQNQEHLIQLALGNTTLLSDALANMATIPDLPSSPFDVLSNVVGATASSITPAQTSSAILSLLV